MDLSRIDLNLFIVFDAIYTHGSITSAAEVLHVTQPAVSNALGRLRGTLNDPLFVRTPKGMAPTPLAQQLIEPIRHSLKSIDNCLKSLQEFHPETARHTFRLNITEQAELMLLPELTAKIAKKAPGVKLAVSFIDRHDVPLEMAAGNIHLTIDAPMINHQELENMPLVSEPYVCVMRKDHPLARKKMTISQYLSSLHIHISSRSRGSGHPDLALRSLGKQREIALRLQHYVSVPNIIKSTNYLASVPEALAKQWDLKVKPLPFDTTPLELHLYWHRSVEHDPGNKWLRHIISQL